MVPVLLPSADRNDLVTLLAPFWSAAKTREALGLKTRQALNERRKAGSILGLKTSTGTVNYPVAQFQRCDERVEVKPALVPFFRVLRDHDSWAVAVLLHTPAPELGGATPLGWVSDQSSRAREKQSALIDLAHAVARDWGGCR